MMQERIGTIVLLCCGAVLANLPFLSERLFGIIAIGAKSFSFRLIEFFVGYAAIALLAVALEHELKGSVYSQGWEFYAVTVCLFTVLAFPGFVVRYLWRQR